MRIYFCSTPKAGSQWFRDLMNNYLLQEHVPWRHRKHEFRELNLYADQWPRSDDEDVFFGPLYRVPPFFVARHIRPRDRVIGVFRDPRDAGMSWMYSALYSHQQDPMINLMRPVLSALSGVERTWLSMFVAYDFCAGQGFWFSDLPENFKVVRYEQLVASTESVLAEIMLFLDTPVPDGVLREVCEAYSFKSLSGGRRPGEENVYSHYRKGVSGDWRNHFTRELGRRVEEFKPGLLRRLGYEDNDLWWQALPERVAEEETPIGEAQEVGNLRNRIAALEEQLRVAETAAEARLQVIETLQQAADERLNLIHELKQVAEERLELARTLEQTSQERLRVIQTLEAVKK